MKKSTWTRLEAGLLAAVLVLFLYSPAQEPQTSEEEYRFRAVELIEAFADWLGLTET